MTTTFQTTRGAPARQFFESAPRVHAGFLIPQQGCDADVIAISAISHMWVHQVGDDWILDVEGALWSWTVAMADNEAGCYQYLHTLLCAINSERRTGGVLS